MLFFPSQSYTYTAPLCVCGEGGGVNGWGAAAKQDHINGACAFKTRLLLVWLRGALCAPSSMHLGNFQKHETEPQLHMRQ